MVNPDDFKAVITRMEDEDGSRARRRDLAEALNVLLRSVHAKNIVEISSSQGYISLWLALGTESTDGHLHVYETDEKKASQLQKNLEEAGLKHRISIIQDQPNSDNIPSNIDMLVLDAKKDDQLKHYKTIFPNIKIGGTIVSDNSISHFAELREYINEVRMSNETSSVMFPLGEGLEVTYKSDPEDPLNQLYTDLIR